MRILYISQYFPPEIGAGASRAKEMVRYLSAQNHQVTVLTGFPSYLTGVIPSRYRKKLVVREWFDEAAVIRVWTSAYRHQSKVWRLLNYVTFMFMATLIGLLGERKYDLVYASSPPLFVGMAGWVVAWWKAKRFIFEIRDIWPRADVMAARLTNRYAAMIGQVLEDFCCARANLVVTVSKGWIDELMNRGIPRSKIHLIKNGVNVDLYKPSEDSNTRRKLGYKGEDFMVVYAGLFGNMQGPSVMLKAAESLGTEGNIKFLLIGDGVKKSELQTQVAEKQIKNVTFLPMIPEDELATYLASCDVGVATLRKTKYSEGCIPVKIFTYMACGLPVILTARGEAEGIVEKSGSGIAVEPEDPTQLTEAILQMYNSREISREMGKKGRQFVSKYYSRKNQAKKLEKALLRLLA